MIPASLHTIGAWTARAGLALVVVLGAVTAGGPARAQDENPLLREQIRVHGELVTLGDLFENAGPAATMAVFRSPDLGKQGVVSSDRLAEAARQHGLEWANPGEIDKVVVQRPSRLVTLDEIADMVARRAARETNGDRESWTVELKHGSKPMHLDPRIGEPVAIKHLILKERTGFFRATVGVDASERNAPDRVYIGRAFRTVAVPVPARPIKRGTIIRDADLEMTRLPVSRVPNGTLYEPGEILDLAAKQRLSAGRPLHSRDLEEPTLVKRNAFVTIVYRKPGLVLKSKGRALADAARGEEVGVVNVQSKRTLQARVTGAGTVSVSSASPQPASGQGALPSRAARGGVNTNFVR